jgi:hypothetical protein
MNPKRARRLQTIWWIVVAILLVYALWTAGDLRGDALLRLLDTGGWQSTPSTTLIR